MNPKVFFVIGPAGSGKSSVSKLVAQRYRAAYIDKDTASTRFTELLLELSGSDKNERDNNAYYQDVLMRLEYATILDLCRDNLAVGNNVVLDAPFGRYFSNPHYLQEAARDHGWPPEAEFFVLHVKVDAESLRERLRGRGYDRDAWKLGNWNEFWSAASAKDCAWLSARHIIVDNNGEVPDVMELDRTLARS